MMKKHFPTLLILLLAVSVLAACQSSTTVQKFPAITFAHEPALQLQVVSVTVEDLYRPKLEPPFVDHRFPTPPVTVMKRWGTDRLVAVGGKPRAVFTIVDASVREVPLERLGGIRGALTTEQTDRYEGRVEATIEIQDPQGRLLGRVNAVAERSRTVPEDFSLNDRERLWFEMTEALMRDFDAEMEKNVRQYLANWLR